MFGFVRGVRARAVVVAAIWHRRAEYLDVSKISFSHTTDRLSPHLQKLTEKIRERRKYSFTYLVSLV